MQFNSYQIGAIEMEVDVEPGEDPIDVFRRVHAKLTAMQDEAAPLKFDQWRRHWREAKERG